jgi:hypothetical protein
LPLVPAKIDPQIKIIDRSVNDLLESHEAGVTLAQQVLYSPPFIAGLSATIHQDLIRCLPAIPEHPLQLGGK